MSSPCEAAECDYVATSASEGIVGCDLPPEPGSPWCAIHGVRYNSAADRYELPDGTEEPGARARRRVEESSPSAFWGDTGE